MWVVASILLCILVIGGLFLIYRKKAKVTPIDTGQAIGAIVGTLTGIVLVEFYGFDYPFPVILMFLGMAAGQIAGIIYEKRKGRKR